MKNETLLLIALAVGAYFLLKKKDAGADASNYPPGYGPPPDGYHYNVTYYRNPATGERVPYVTLIPNQ